MDYTIHLTVNAREYTLRSDPRRRLLDLLREDLGLIGTKEGCGEGECGACTIILNGELVNSCLVPVGQADQGEIKTIEGLTQGQELHPLQKAFLEAGAVQCGYCTPGMILAAYYLLEKNPDPTKEEIKEGLSGNLCRCTGYQKIIEAVQKAARGGVGHGHRKVHSSG